MNTLRSVNNYEKKLALSITKSSPISRRSCFDTLATLNGFAMQVIVGVALERAIVTDGGHFCVGKYVRYLTRCISWPMRANAQLDVNWTIVSMSSQYYVNLC